MDVYDRILFKPFKKLMDKIAPLILFLLFIAILLKLSGAY